MCPIIVGLVCLLLAAVALEPVVEVDLGAGGSNETEDALIQVHERLVAVTEPDGQHVLLLIFISVPVLELLREVHAGQVRGPSLLELSLRYSAAGLVFGMSVGRPGTALPEWLKYSRGGIGVSLLVGTVSRVCLGAGRRLWRVRRLR
jgi:hypothetical protein